MKINILLFLLISAFTGFAQTNVYTFNNGVVYTEKQMIGFIDTVERTTPKRYQVVPVIYHKVVRKDTVLNYLVFTTDNLNGHSRKPIKIIYQQDSLFLLLNKPLPEFELTDLNGETISSATLRGRPTLINFWNTLCGPCIAEMPQLSKLKDKYGNQMNFLSVTDDQSKDIDLAGFLKNKGFNYPVLENGGDYKHLLKITALPRNIFLDKDGIVRYIQGNYPVDLQRNEIPADSPDNYFTKIVNRLIDASK
ncbi:MAG: TlpA disulfide reductase family protein [Bacteroidota bacterium]